ncbi:hypothetical protein HY030_00595 [Candidatus Gottesmanbacteria bacterium]|nr:hypothetical protein [Candidatus Gottesmanbacteria bacterium]
MTREVAAYIAGFLDGDGSIRIQLQPRKTKLRVRAIISFAQKWGKEKEMRWIRKQLKIGYIYQRNDRITELKIEGFEQVERILRELKPHILFKRKQLQLMLQIMNLIKGGQNLLKIAQLSDKISRLNYATTKKRYTASYVKTFLKSNTPVTT